MINLYEWQKDALRKMYKTGGKNFILSAPTGAGKTNVFLLFWKNVLRQRDYKMIITAPIKALSNQRYRELKDCFDVAIETGDIKENTDKDWDILVCTQEIYTNKYADMEKVFLVIDEFHYINENQSRARTYIDALYKSKAEYIFICSATLGDLSVMKSYVEKVSNRKFKVLEYNSRPTKLIYTDKEFRYGEIKNALVVTFSFRNCIDICGNIIWERDVQSDKNIKEIMKIARKLDIKNEDLLEYTKYGIAYYMGKMLPKEKLFIEKLFAKQLIDTVVGTDALSLGVNFPAKYVIFSQLEKYYDGLISKNLFEQISGRAGRKGYFNTGYVGILADDSFESFNSWLKDNYYELLESENENLNISLDVNYGDIFKNKAGILTEAYFVSKFSQNSLNMNDLREEIKETIEFYSIVINELSKSTPYFKKYFIENYFDEYDIEQNIIYLYRLINGEYEEIIFEQGTFSDLLQFRKYIKQLNRKFKRKFNIKTSIVENYIKEIDKTAISI